MTPMLIPTLTATSTLIPLYCCDDDRRGPCPRHAFVDVWDSVFVKVQRDFVVDLLVCVF